MSEGQEGSLRPVRVDQESSYTANEMMIISAARALSNEDVCFVGIGAPSAACNLARLTHAPDLTLIYESGTIGTRPAVLPLSIGDGALCETAVTTVSVPEMFRYWLQGGRISIGFLGAAQLDRHGNINTTVIGDYANPKIRLPGGGGAPEIASSCGQIFVTLRHSPRGLVERVDFVTSLGFGRDGDGRRRRGISTRGPSLVITDLWILEPESNTHELVVTSIHPGVDRQTIRQQTGWAIRFGEDVSVTKVPDLAELTVLRDLVRRSEEAQNPKPSNRGES